MKRIQRKGILNTVAASAANLKIDATAKQNVVCNDNTADPLVDILPPFPYGEKYDVTSEAAVEEVTQIVLVGKNTSSDALETVVAGRKYKMTIRSIFQTREAQSKAVAPFTYSYEAPINLTGTVNTDRYNMYYDLVTKINIGNAYGNNVTASLVQAVPFNTGSYAGGTPPVGTTITQTTSGYTGIVADVVITSGTFAGGNAAGTMYLYSTTGTMSDSYNYTFLSTGSAVSNGAGVLGQGLVVLDDADYWVPKGTISSVSLPAEVRTGASEVKLTAYNTDGSLSFATANAEVVRAAVYSKGKGAHMSKWVPVFHWSGMDRVSGDIEMIFNDTVDTSKYYTRVIVTLKKKGDTGLLSQATSDFYNQYELYLAQTSSTVVGSNVTDLVAAIVAMS